MTEFQLSEREELLLNAALNPSVDIAQQSWENWASQGAIETAPHHELRLLPAVYAHLSSIAPAFRLPSKLRGKAKAIFTRSNLLASATLPMIKELNRHSPVMLTKGLAMCIRFGTWSSRTMADVDIHVPAESLETVCGILANSGWTPRYGLTLPSLIHRTSLRRDSWNFTKGAADIDLHWRLPAGPAENWLAEEMWQSGERFEFRGHTLLLQSPEFALVSSLRHGFLLNDRGDALQTVVDAVLLLPVCKTDRLPILLEKSELLGPFRELSSILERVGARGILPKLECEPTHEIAPGKWRDKPKTERSLLRRPFLYRLWNLLGRKSSLERLIVRTSGPFSKPLSGKTLLRADYDLSDCAILDEVGGPGWAWPQSGCFWSDRADARLLIPLQHAGDHLLFLGLTRDHSRNSRLWIFANGYPVTRIDFAKGNTADYCLMIPRKLLFGPWVELSLRPHPNSGREANPGEFGVPVKRLRVVDLHRIVDVHQMVEFLGLQNPKPLYLKILNGDEPEASKFARIKKKIDTSARRGSSKIPQDFDPISYVLSYPDLFEREVDPYEHYVSYGRRERRFYRFVR